MKRKGDNSQVIQLLNEVLTAELTAINQYMVHSEMCGAWGYESLHKKMHRHAIDEMKHAEQMIERVLFLEGIPNVQRLFKINIGERVPEMFKSDLALEEDAIERLNKGIALCVEQSDNATRALLEQVLVSEEEHYDWIEAQIAQIEQVGAENYLAQHIHERS